MDFSSTSAILTSSSPSSPSHPSQRTRPRPGRRRNATTTRPRCVSSLPLYSSKLFALSTLLLLLTCCCHFSSAQHVEQFDTGYLLGSTLDKLAKRGEILIDRRPPPDMLARRKVLEARQGGGSPFGSSGGGNTVTLSNPAASAPTPSTEITLSKSAASSPHSQSASPTASQKPTSTGGLAVDPSATAGAIPSVFDTSLGNNFTATTCPSFFSDFLANKQFQSCLPFSLLLQNSNSFFQTTKSFQRTSQALDATCNVVFSKCLPLMGDLARQIKSDNNCGQDFRLQNPIVLQAYNGFLAYQPLYQAGCLKSPTGSYCFADAITNTSSPTDSYVYFTALGVTLPGGSRPTCNKCLSETMAIFRSSAGNTTMPLSTTYVAAAQQIQLACGPNFVDSNVVMKGAASSTMNPSSSAGLVTFALLATIFHLFF